MTAQDTQILQTLLEGQASIHKRLDRYIERQEQRCASEQSRAAVIDERLRSHLEGHTAGQGIARYAFVLIVAISGLFVSLWKAIFP